MLKETDFYGIKSEKLTDKSDIFEIFYGDKLKNAPMIKKTTITHIYKLVKNIDF